MALVKNTAAAEDIVQDCFVALAQAPQRLKLNGNLKSYLATCVVNRARNWLKAAANNTKTTALNEAMSAKQNCDKPEKWIIENEQLQKINRALEKLPYKQRETVSLHLRADMTFREIARLQAVSINTVRSRYRYALGKLQSILNSEIEK